MSPEAIGSVLALCVVSAALGAARAKMSARPREPVEGQPGKDLVWVPTPPQLVEAMLDTARVAPGDYVVDLGSGDGRCVIGAAKRGARAVGVEYDATLLELSRRNALAGGVGELATFVRGDFLDFDLAGATVLTLFLLPDVLEKLEPKLAKLPTGTRIVTNRYGVPGWEPVEVRRIGGDTADCCTALLFVIGAQRGGRG